MLREYEATEVQKSVSGVAGARIAVTDGDVGGTYHPYGPRSDQYQKSGSFDKSGSDVSLVALLFIRALRSTVRTQ